MSKGAATIAELHKAVAILKTRDSARAREIKALRGDIDRVEALIAQPLPPATNSTGKSFLPSVPATAGTARWQRVRSLFTWLRT